MTAILALLLVWGAYPAGITVYTLLGKRYGARAPALLLYPFPIIVLQVFAWGVLGGDIQASAASGLRSLLMVMTWAVAYFYLADWLESKIPAGFKWSVPWLTVLGAIGASTGVQFIFRVDPFSRIMTALGNNLVLTSIFGVVMVVLGYFLLRLPAWEESPAPADASLNNIMGRIMTILLITWAIEMTRGGSEPWLYVTNLFLTSFPRITLELTVSTHAGNGTRSARQLLSGLPIGLGASLIWCLGVLWLPSLMDMGVALAVSAFLAGVWTLGVGMLFVFKAAEAIDFGSKDDIEPLPESA